MYKRMGIPGVILLFFIISLLLKVSVGVTVYKMKGTTSFCDDWKYISYANQIIEQGIWVPHHSKLLSDEVDPGLPLILAILFSIFGENYLVPIVVNGILGGLLTLLIFYLGKNIFNETVGIFASFWTIFYELYYRWAPRVLREMWTFFLFPLIIYMVFLEAKENKVTLKILLISLLFAFFVHLDERFFLYFPLIAVIIPILNHQSLKTSFKKSLIFFVLVLLLMIPWTIRNYKVYGRVVILTKRTDIILDSKKRRSIQKKEPWYLSEAQIDSIASGLRTYNRHPLEIERIKRGVVPEEYTKWEQCYNKFLEFWAPCRLTPGYIRGGFRFESRSLRHNLVLMFSYGVLLPFFFVGLYLTFKIRNIKGIIIISIIVIHIFMFFWSGSYIDIEFPLIYLLLFLPLMGFSGYTIN